MYNAKAIPDLDWFWLKTQEQIIFGAEDLLMGVLKLKVVPKQKNLNSYMSSQLWPFSIHSERIRNHADRTLIDGPTMTLLRQWHISTRPI